MQRIKAYRLLFMLVLLCGLGFSLPAQQDWTWTFGDSVVMHFPGGGAPAVDPNARSVYTLESGSCISDAGGNLKYYAMGYEIYRQDGTIPPGSYQLTAPDFTNAYLLLPVWGDTTDYLLFFIGYGCVVPAYCPWLAEIKGSPGQDSVTDFRSLGDYHPTHLVTEKVAAVRDAQGTGWWVIYHGLIDNTFIKFKVDGNQVAPLDTQMIGSVHGQVGNNPYASLGEITFSPQGDKLMLVTVSGIIDIFDFDRCTGDLSNWLELGTPAPNPLGPDTYYGCSFSPDGSKVYVSEGDNSITGGDRLFQFDLNAPNTLASKTLLFTFPDSVELGQHQLGPDGKIYITQIYVDLADTNNIANQYISAINNPNAAGLACNFVYQQVYLQGLHSTLNLPNLPNFNLSPLVAQVAEAGPPQVVLCPGDSLQIGYPDTSNGAVTYAWTAHPDIGDTTRPQLWVHPSQSTWYYLTAVDSGFGLSCGKTIDSIHVVVVDSAALPVLSLPSDTSFCPGDSVLIGVVEDSSRTYVWSPMGQDTSQIMVSQPGTYTLIVRNPQYAGACFADTAAVRVDTVARVVIPYLQDATICLGDSMAIGAVLPVHWVGSWTPSAGLLAPDSVYTLARPVVTTTYVLFASDTTGAGTCASVQDTVHITVEIPFTHPRPENQEFCPGEILTVGVPSVSAFSYAWSPVTGLNNPYVSSTTVSPLTPIVYMLAVTSDTMISENCKTQYFPVSLASDGCIQQNVVTPNGDGVNDFLVLGSYNGPVSVSIFDRWGAAIFSSNDYRGNWPLVGSQLPETVYWYVVKVASEGGKAFVGEVMVLR